MALASLSSAISGLQTNNEWMTVIANNIANVNSIAYKEQRMTFADQIYQTLGAASGANAGENLGGINPEELGLGDVVGSVDMIMSQGAIQTTGNALDVAITGQGFFEVKSGSNVNFTRAGNFGQDDVGNIVTSSGAILQGWQGAVVRQMGDVDPGLNPQLELDAETYKINTAQAPSNLSIQPGLTLEAQETSTMNIAGNLDSLQGVTNPPGLNPAAIVGGNLPGSGDFQNTGAIGPTTVAAVNANPLLFVGDTPDATATQTIYDSLGNAHQITLWFFQSANLNNVPPAAANRPTWQWYAFDTTGGPASAANCLAGTDITTTWINPTVPPVNVAQTNSLIWFNQDGSLASNGGLNDIAAAGVQAAPFIVLPVVDNAQGQIPDGAIGDQMVTINFGNSNVWNAAGQVEVNVGANSAVAAVGDLGDRSGLTGDVDGSFSTINGAQVYTANNTVYGKSQNGFASGVLTGLSVASDGTINGTFSNSQTIGLAKIAMATFANPQGLAQLGDSLYGATANSGEPDVNSVASSGSKLTGGALESSNVDLSTELTNMIVAQQSFDANARVITADNDILTTLSQIGNYQ